jgi:hypothetical protein
MDSPQTSFLANSSIQESMNDDVNLLSFNREISDLSSKIGSIIFSTKDLHYPYNGHDDEEGEEETTQSASINGNNSNNNSEKLLKRNKGYKKLYHVPKRIRKAAKQLANILTARPSTAK